jgi:hypothetical protein
MTGEDGVLGNLAQLDAGEAEREAGQAGGA